MAYNLQPLITILEQILDPEQNRWILEHNKPQLQSLHQKVASLQQILEKSSLTNIQNLETQIRISAHKAEDIIESNMVDMMLSNPEKALRFTFSTHDFQQVMQELDYVMKQVVKLVEEKTIASGMPFSHDLSSRITVDEDHSVQSKAVVGLDDALSQLKERVMEMQSKLEIVPIVGMGGIGKTTLARELYQDPCIVRHFQYFAWATVSQDYNIHAILLSLLRCIIGKECDQYTGKESHELKIILYRSLYGRRYIIVLDDIWSSTFWDEIRNYLPNYNNRSRIVITTRESEVAKHADSQSVQHQMQLLSESASWDLLRQIVFGEEGCPDFLQGIGEKIARDCSGLPLAISVIGGILSEVERSKHGWENIANNVADAIAEADEGFSNILSLSYNHLPNHLKPCFLYMGAFPEDYEIKGSRLVRLWVAEGFVKSNGHKSLEEVAEDWLKALVERNLFLVTEYKYGKPRLFGMHDLLRDLCIRKSNEDQFVSVKNSLHLEAASSNPRRVCVHLSGGLLKDDNASAESMSLARSFILICHERSQDVVGAIPILRLLRVLDLRDPRFKDLPEEIFELVNLRFLALYTYSRSLRGILRLRNLRTFVTSNIDLHYLPPEIFEMSELRHLKSTASICIEEEDMKKMVLNKLRSIYELELTGSLIRSGFLECIPDIEKLGFFYSDSLTSNAVDLSHLHKLKTLRLHFNPLCREYLSAFRFPCDLRKLLLFGVVILQSDMTTLSALPNLEELEMVSCKFESEEGTSVEVWEVAEGVEFCSLQVLRLISMNNLVRWRADESNFPRLRFLHLDHCQELEEIPSGIGEIPTLQSIRLEWCSNSAEASARLTVEEQQSEYGNYNIKLHVINFSHRFEI